jgi:hypothetical protein
VRPRYRIPLLLIGAAIGSIYFFRGPDPDDRVQHKVLEAARKGDVSALERLYSAGARLNSPASYEGGAHHSIPPIFEAIEHERVEAVSWLLSRGADPSRLSATETPLDLAKHYAKERPNSGAMRSIVAILQAHGAKCLTER